MKKFLSRVGIALSLVLLIHAATVILFANGKINGFYLRFTTPRQHSLILGNSRAAQAVVPHVLDSSLANLNFQGPVFNYAFSLSTSPYGPYYLASIKKKLDHSTQKGLFILSVDPWSISREAHLATDDTTKFFDANSFPYNIHFVNWDPNLEFLLKNYNAAWGDMIIANTVRTIQAELHPNGWLEVTVPMHQKRHEERILGKIKRYRNENFYSKTFSPLRLAYLNRTIRYLQGFGDVYLVRIPLDPRLADIEKEYMPQFDELMKTSAIENNVPYLNYFEDNALYQTIDGNHLFKESSKLFSKRLAEDIRNHINLRKEILKE